MPIRQMKFLICWSGPGYFALSFFFFKLHSSSVQQRLWMAMQSFLKPQSASGITRGFTGPTITGHYHEHSVRMGAGRFVFTNWSLPDSLPGIWSAGLWYMVKNLCQAEDLSSNPGFRRSSQEGNGYHNRTLENPLGQRVWQTTIRIGYKVRRLSGLTFTKFPALLIHDKPWDGFLWLKRHN